MYDYLHFSESRHYSRDANSKPSNQPSPMDEAYLPPTISRKILELSRKHHQHKTTRDLEAKETHEHDEKMFVPEKRGTRAEYQGLSSTLLQNYLHMRRLGKQSARSTADNTGTANVESSLQQLQAVHKQMEYARKKKSCEGC